MTTDATEKNESSTAPEAQALPAAPGASVSTPPAAKNRRQRSPLSPKKRRKLRRLITLGVILLVFAAAAIFISAKLRQARAVFSESSLVTASVERRDITESLTGTGTLQPADSYTVTTLISGEILSAPFEEGDVLEKDALLYEVDSSDIATSIERAELTVSQAQKSYDRAVEARDNLTITAPAAGTVVSLDVDPGDSVSMGQALATVRNSSVMSLTLPFGSDDAARLSVGQSAVVTPDGSLETLGGTVTKVSAVDEVLTGNRLIRKVTIEVTNPGGITPGLAATAVVNGIACTDSGTFSYKADSVISAQVSGDVSSIPVSEGQFVSEGQTLIVLSSDSVEDQIENARNSLRDAELALDNQNDKLDSYQITSPIAGTVIEKNYKEGDTLEAGKTLCTVFDLSYLTMTLYVDELDISQVSVGQDVSITADAVEGKTYAGVVTKVNINGTTTGGATSYPVTIRIDDTDGLLPGMNVDAVIVISSVKNVLAVPSEAVVRGSRVLVKSADSSAQAEDPTVPAGYAYAEVVVGASDDDYVEITSGLSEGDVIAYTRAETNTNDMMMFGLAGGGGFGGGDMPSGGGGFGGGDMPSGGGMGGPGQ